MSIAEQHNVPAAWYPDQSVPNQLRWWDGRDWTSDVRPNGPAATAASTETPLLETRRGLHAVAAPAQGFGAATADQLRAWPPPQPEQRSDVQVPVRETPREWAANESVGAIKGWMAKSAGTVEEPSYSDHYVGSQPVDYFTEAAMAASEDLSTSASVAVPVESTASRKTIPFPAVPVESALDAPIAATRIAGSLSAFPPVEPMPEPTAVAAPHEDTVEEIAETSPYGDFSDWQPAAPGSTPEPVAETEVVAAPAPKEIRDLSAVTSHQVAPQGAVALSRRQLREMLGGPLTNGAEAV